MIKQYILKDKKDGRPVSRIVLDTGLNYIDCYEIHGWTRDEKTGKDIIPYDEYFVAHVYARFDGCTHWWFRGEDYEPGTDEGFDSYYHICGEYCLLSKMIQMAFIWEVAAQQHSEWRGEFYDGEYRLDEVRKLLLSDYEITTEELKEEEND